MAKAANAAKAKTAKTAKSAAKTKAKAKTKTKATSRDPDRDPIESGDVAARRGTVEIWSYDTWTGMAVRAQDMDALADALEQAKGVREVRRDVTAAALAG